MSKQSYINGFVKAAAAHKVDPRALAQYALAKQADAAAGAPAADAGGSYTEKIKELIGQAHNWYNGQNEAVKGLIGAGTGAALGIGLGTALKGKSGIRPGAILGAVGGGAAAVDWKALAEALGKLGEQAKAKAATNGGTQAPAANA